MKSKLASLLRRVADRVEPAKPAIEVRRDEWSRPWLVVNNANATDAQRMAMELRKLLYMHGR